MIDLVPQVGTAPVHKIGFAESGIDACRVGSSNALHRNVSPLDDIACVRLHAAVLARSVRAAYHRVRDGKRGEHRRKDGYPWSVNRMSIIKVTDMAYARVTAPDLNVAETFLTDFGLTISARTENALYARGTDSPHHIYIAEKGPPRLISFAYYAAR